MHCWPVPLTAAASTYINTQQPWRYLQMKSTKPSKPQTSSKFLENIVVSSSQGKPVLLSSLWKDRAVILKVLPRLGCRLCKYEARSMGDLRMVCNPEQVALAAVCFDDPDLQTFLADGYWDWDIFIDPERQVYKKAQLHRLTKWQYVKDLMVKRIWAMNSYILQKFAYTNSLKGDMSQLGGTFVIGQGGKILYQFRPTKLAMYPSIKEIFASLGGDPDDIDEPTPLEHVFTQEQSRLLYNTRTSSTSDSSLDSFPKFNF
ncbi:hypothetical protein DSO57_1019797 [Entomophthora muscae]|uniref:Uncharacterized protein n=1 Tax=Entomophthora muscae TaxID=34485 RepID=A0ACC2UR16_9FUNG|nr:hypothetical protein DSO57_1019797 [Entomophthora muscae]